MKLENLDIGKVIFAKAQHEYHLANKMKSLAFVEVEFNGISAECKLIRGEEIKNNELEHYYFVELPCRYFVIKKKGWKKANFLNFEDKQFSNLFQVLALKRLSEKHPQLFEKPIKKERKDKNEQNEKS